MERTLHRRKTSSLQTERNRDQEKRSPRNRSHKRRRRLVEPDDEFEDQEISNRSKRDERENHSRPRRRRYQPERSIGGRQEASQREEYRSRRHRRGPSVRREDETYRVDSTGMFGEHPASRGYKEYAGSNKRHPGLLGRRSQRMDLRSTKNEEGLMRKLDDERLYRLGRKKRPRNHRNSTHLAISDYENRRQYETTFHPMQMYDPVKSQYEQERFDELRNDDHIYRYDGYQESGNTEGFGGRQSSRQQGHDWLDDDEYREGHAPRYRGHGKYGSR